ncbi:MAG: 1-acyl-sn-glycerol-3-phosphate acyltransferase [Armatimonadetes bacterium]|nr:1-acyl-sn-glycerol-3-phosphate acyltransferase [Armatimonadota bacterium]
MAFLLLGPVRRIGNVPPADGQGLLLLANHRSDCDPIIVQLVCRRHVVFMGKQELFEMPSIGWFMKLWMAFPVKRGEPDRSSLKHAIKMAKAGFCVCVFPEGQLTETHKLQPLLPGVSLIARQAEVPVVCLGLRATERIMPYGKVIPRPAFGWVEGHWGEPRTFSRESSPEEVMGWATQELLRLSGESEGPDSATPDLKPASDDGNG